MECGIEVVSKGFPDFPLLLPRLGGLRKQSGRKALGERSRMGPKAQPRPTVCAGGWPEPKSTSKKEIGPRLLRFLVIPKDIIPVFAENFWLMNPEF